MVDDVVDEYENMKDKASGLLDQGSNKAKDLLEQGKDKVAGLADTGKEKVDSWKSDTKHALS